MYAKLINETTIEPVPDNKDGWFNYNQMTDLLVKDGYLPLEPLPAYPNDGNQYQLMYKEDNGKIVGRYEKIEPNQPPQSLTYADLRARNYPDPREFLDAQVKINSGDAELIAEGQKQLDAYVTGCLEVKTIYPKPEEN